MSGNMAAGRHGAGASSRELTSDPQTGYTSFNKAAPPNLYQAVPPTRDQHSDIGTYEGHIVQLPQLVPVTRDSSGFSVYFPIT